MSTDNNRFDGTNGNGYQPLPDAPFNGVPPGPLTLENLDTPITPAGPVFVVVEEQTRTYTFPDGLRLTLEGVVSINVSKSGTHRINTTDGLKHIVPPGWIHIEFDAEHWTF